MHNECIHLGDLLRQTRQERNLSLKEVENATSIRLGYLESIEEGHFGKLISPIYAQGFIKKYATFLDLDGDLLLREHPSVLKFLSEKPSDKSDFTLGLGSIEVRGTPAGEVKWLPNVLLVGLSVFVILGGWFLARYLGLF